MTDVFDNLVDQPGENDIDFDGFDFDIDDGQEAEEEQAVETETTEEETEVADEETAEESSEETTEEESTEEATEVSALEDLEVTFLGENKALKDFKPDELKSYIQKGMNQERLQNKYNETADQLSEMKEIAELYGFKNINEMRDAVLESHFKSVAENEGRKPEDVRREYLSNKQSRVDKMYDTFAKAYPDVKPEDLPQDVKEAVRDGEDLTQAYKKHMTEQEAQQKNNTIESLKAEIETLKKSLSVKEQNANSKKKGVIKPVTGKDSIEVESDFMRGFLQG